MLFRHYHHWRTRDSQSAWLRTGNRGSWTCLALPLLLLLTGCGTTGSALKTREQPVFQVVADDSLSSQHAPVIAVENISANYNRIGTIRAGGEGDETIFVDTNEPTYYVESQTFVSDQQVPYKNLIYRMHFEKVPLQLLPFHLTAGKFGGLFVIVTLDSEDRPVLLTTLHTCGCYLAFIPTSYLPRAAWPKGWSTTRQDVYGESLPSSLEFPETFDPNFRIRLLIRDGSHRVMDANVIDIRSNSDAQVLQTTLAPLDSLTQLKRPDGSTTSFYVDSGWRKGYVKGSFKPFELLLMSWWALDPLVGVDKRLGNPEETGTVFYTSLRPWYRKDSALDSFAAFLTFWGWKL